MMELRVWILIILIATLPFAFLYARRKEKQEFNNGYCKYCKTKLKPYHASKNHNNRYFCDNCGFVIEIYYKTDKHFHN